MNSILDFRPFPKLARLTRTVTITEKLDGTNAQIVIAAKSPELDAAWCESPGLMKCGEFYLRAGSRNRWLSTVDDNYGFARWVNENSEELCGLGVGQHFGEWWGLGIQRNYGVSTKRFSLFNVGRWAPSSPQPACCSLVPVLRICEFDTDIIQRICNNIRDGGSIAARGFANPEGIVVYHHASGQLFKKTCEHDESPKGVPGLTDPAQLVAGIVPAQETFNSTINS